jgi:hypothetical protein
MEIGAVSQIRLGRPSFLVIVSPEKPKGGLLSEGEGREGEWAKVLVR